MGSHEYYRALCEIAPPVLAMTLLDHSIDLAEASAAPVYPPHSMYARVGKRGLDFALAVTGLVILSPVFLIVAAAVKLGSPGPVFYLQDRVGRSGRLFKIIKFRSMVVGADRTGVGITTASDRRITKVGAILRKMKLDELPQLWNVVRGDMSLVGPRPELPQYVSHYSAMAKAVLCVRPGITDNASILFRHEEKLLVGDADEADRLYRDVVLPRKLALGRTYITTMSLYNDLLLIVKTLVSLVSHNNTLAV